MDKPFDLAIFAAATEYARWVGAVTPGRNAIDLARAMIRAYEQAKRSER